MIHFKFMHSLLYVALLPFAGIFVTSCVAKPGDVDNSIAWVYRDKIRMGWSPSDLKQYSLMTKAGMNAVMPREELDVSIDYDASKADTPLSKNDAEIISAICDSSRVAKETGLHYFHCLNLAAQAQTYQTGFQDNPARYNDGTLPSPVDPVYWNRVIMNRVSRVLDLLKDQKTYALDAIIIDPEMYALGGGLPGNPDYGKYAFETFLHEIKRELPGGINNVEGREKWIAGQGLQNEYKKWQFDRIKSFGRQLEQMVHKRRPSLILGYIIYEDKMWFHAMAAGLSTPQHPVFIGPENTYSGVMDDRMIAYFQQIRNDVKVPTMLVPGVMMGLDHDQIPHEFLQVVPGNVYQRCQFSEGYWVYAIYNFGDTAEQQTPFFNALKKIDNALDQQAQTGKPVDLKAAPIPVPKPPGFVELLKDASNWKPVPDNVPKAKQPYAPAKLRGSFALLFWPHPKQSLQLSLSALQLGVYLDQLDATLFDQEGNIIWKDFSPIGRPLEVKSPPSTEKVIGGIVGAGWNAFSIGSANCPMTIVPQEFLTVNAQRAFAGRFYFYVPENRDSFQIVLQGDPGEYVDYTLYDPENQPVLSLKQLKATRTEDVKVTKSGVWCIEVDNAVDDAGVKLEGIPNVFALRPQDVMIPESTFTK
jgi:hypothetical protein